MGYLQVNALSDWIIGIYLHEFTNNEREISIPHESVNIFFIQIECTANKNRQTLSQPKPWCNDSGVLNLHHGYYTTIMTSKKLFRHNPVPRGTNQPIRKSEFVQCMKLE